MRVSERIECNENTSETIYDIRHYENYLLRRFDEHGPIPEPKRQVCTGSAYQQRPPSSQK
jgi:hypothetical protein